MTVWHTNLSSRWQDFPLSQQIMMINNELNRAANNIEYPQEYANSLERALELCDLCSADERWRGNRLKELRRARMILAGMYLTPPQSNTVLMRQLMSLDVDCWRAYGGD